MNAQTHRKAQYASATKVKNFVKLARDLGLDVAGFEVTADGAIRVMEARAKPSTPVSDFDRYKDEL
jgi:hypothetical protein